LIQLKLLEEDFRLKFRSLLEGYLRLLKEAPLTVTGPEGALGTGVPAKAPPDSAKAAPTAASVAEESVPVAPRSAPAPEEPAAPIAPRPVPEPVPQLVIPVSGPAQRQDDEAPTQEHSYSTPEEAGAGMSRPIVQPDRAAVDETTAETSTAEPAPGLVRPVPGEPEDAESPRGFFFGRQMENLDDSFVGEDGTKKDKTRDFEW
jgi:hypothetical protein